MDIFLIILGLLITALLFGSVFIFRSKHRRLWKGLAEEYGWKFVTGKLTWFLGTPMSMDRMTGTYRGRKFRMLYRLAYGGEGVGEFGGGGFAFYNTQIIITAACRPQGQFRLDQNRLFKRKGAKGKTNDRYFDKKSRIYHERPKGFTGDFLADPVLRRRVAKFFANPMMDDRKVSLTPVGNVRLQDTGLHQSEKRFLMELELLSDLAEVVEKHIIKE